MHFRTLTLSSALALAVCSQAATANTRLVVNCFWPAQNFMCQDVLPGWIEDVERVTEGRVTGIIPPRTLAAPNEQWSMVESGIADVTAAFSGFTGDHVQGPLVTGNLFTATNSTSAMTQALWETYQQYFPDEYQGVVPLSLWVLAPGQFYSLTDDPIDELSDLSERRVWTTPGNTAELLRAIGSSVVAGPAVQSNELISRGVVDAFIGVPAETLRSFQLIPYVRSMTISEPALSGPAFTLFINEGTWADITPEDQEAIRGVSGLHFAMETAAAWQQAEIDATDALREAGVEILQASPEFVETLAQYATAVNQGWIDAANAKGIDAEAALEFYVQRARELSASLSE